MPEIRELIWYQVAAAEPRIVQLKLALEHNTFGSATSVPAMLHANTEARCIGLKVYTTHVNGYSSHSSTYINLENDFILVCDSATAIKLIDTNRVSKQVNKAYAWCKCRTKSES